MTQQELEFRYIRLQALKGFLENGQEQFSLATDLEGFFFGERTGCSCKYNTVRSKLNQYWESTGKFLYEQYGQ